MIATGGARTHARLAAVAAVVAILVAVGTPLLGLRVFAGTDLLEGFAPWDTVPPDGEVSNPLVSDLIDSSLPDRRVAVDRLRGGDLPLWQPYANGGRPLAALPNLGLLSPLNWPYLVLPLWYAPGAVQAVTMLVSLAGVVAWLRRLGTSTVAALLAGLAFTLSGFAVVYAGFPAGHIAALTPLGLWAADVATDTRRSWARVVPLALVVAAMWFEGFPQVTAFAVLAMGGWAVATVVDRRRGDEGPAPGAGQIARTLALPLAAPLLAVVLGTAVAAVQLAPFLADTARLDLSAREQTADDHLPGVTALTVVAPDVLGTATGQDWFGPLNELEVQSAVAVPALVLAAVGLVATPRRRAWRVGVVLAMGTGAAALTWVGGPLLAMAQRTPLFALADVHRVRLLAVVALTLLAAQGVDRLLAGTRPTARETVGVGALAAGGIAAVGLLAREAWALAPSTAALAVSRRSLVTAAALGVATLVLVGVAWSRPRTAGVAVAGLLALTVVSTLPLPARFWPRTDRALFYPATPTHDFLRAAQDGERLLTDGLVLLPGTTSFYGLRTAAAHAFPVPAWQDLLEAVDPDAYRRLSPTFPAVVVTPAVATSPVLDRLAVRHLVLDPDRPALPDLSDAGIEVVHTGDAVVLERDSALPRIRWATTAEVVPDPDARVARLADPALPADTVVLSTGTSTRGGGGATLEVLDDDGDTVHVRVDADADGWLVVADTLDDFVASLDGAPVDLVAADHAFGAVAVPAGTHEVHLSYRPAGLRGGAMASLVGVLGLTALLASSRRRPRTHDDGLPHRSREAQSSTT